MDEIEIAEAKILSDVAELIKTIEAMPPDQAFPWFREMLLAILQSTLTDYNLVLASLSHPASMTAWARRCLLELNVVCEYVLASGSNAATFHNEMLIDNKEFYDAIKAYTESGHAKLVALSREVAQNLITGNQREALEKFASETEKTGAQTKEAEKAALEFQSLIEELKIEDQRIQKYWKMASPELRKEFLSMNRICSKLAHRSAFSIGLQPSQDLDELITTFKTTAFSDVITIFSAVKDHIEQHGVRPMV